MGCKHKKNKASLNSATYLYYCNLFKLNHVFLWLFATLHQELLCHHFGNLNMYLSYELSYSLITSVIIDKFPLCVFQLECLSLDCSVCVYYALVLF